MKVLWITNILFPEAKSILNGEEDLKSSGGWMLGSADQLVCREDVNLYIATVSPVVTRLKVLKGEKIVFYVRLMLIIIAFCDRMSLAKNQKLHFMLFLKYPFIILFCESNLRSFLFRRLFFIAEIFTKFCIRK